MRAHADRLPFVTLSPLLPLRYETPLHIIYRCTRPPHVGCTRAYDDAPREDYDRLFPFKGPERPRISYEDQDVRLGDPDAPVSDFVYPGVNIDRDVRTTALR